VPAYASPGGIVEHIRKGFMMPKYGSTLNGKTEVTQKWSFSKQENLVVTIENDLEVSKKVNIKATADYALFYDVYFGEAGKP
jgi:RNA polymerase subunit RPABC4/transcription elongation factor Spt4